MGFFDSLTSKAANKSIDVVATAIDGTAVSVGWSTTGGPGTVDVLADSQVGNIKHIYKGVPWAVSIFNLGMWLGIDGPKAGDILTLSFKGGHPGFPVVTAWKPGPISNSEVEYAKRDKVTTPHATVAPPTPISQTSAAGILPSNIPGLQ